MQLQTIKNLCCSTCLVFLSCLYANLGIRYFIKDVQYKSVAASLFLYCQIYSTASEFYGYYASSWHHPFAIWDSYFTNSAIRMLNYLVFNELSVFCFWLIQIKFLDSYKMFVYFGSTYIHMLFINYLYAWQGSYLSRLVISRVWVRRRTAWISSSMTGLYQRWSGTLRMCWRSCW